MSIHIDTASKGELKAYARDELGLSLSMNMGEDTMRQKIRDKLDELGEPEPAVDLGKVKVSAKDKSNWIRIIVARTSEKGGGLPVPVSPQGKTYTIPRGVEVDVPPEVEFILWKAVKTEYEEPEESGMPMIARDVQSYPYQIVSGQQNVIRPRDHKAA